MLISKNFYNLFLGLLTKNGNASASMKLLTKVFLMVSKKTGLSHKIIALKAFLSLNIFVEVKSVKRRKFKHLIPFPISLNRKLYLAAKWIISSALEDKRKVGFADKLSQELIVLVTNKKLSKSYKKRRSTLSLAIKNKSNVHFRW